MPEIRSSVVRKFIVGGVIAILGMGSIAAIPAAANTPEVRLSIGFSSNQDGTVVVAARPGNVLRVPVTMRNRSDASIEAKTFAANPQTATNGGYTTAESDVKKTGATKWVEYPDETFMFAANSTQNRTAVIKVPSDAEPGEYVVGLVIQNAKPVGISQDGGIQLGQFHRQSAAMTIKIPGPAKPGVAFREASYTNNNGQFFFIDLAAANTGNRILRPEFVMTLKDEGKNTLQTFNHTMRGFYPETSTKLRMTLEDPLPNGQYYVDVTMTGGGLNEPVVASDVPFTVDDQSNEGSGGSPSAPTPIWVWVLLAIAILIIIGGVIWLVRRRKEQAIEARAAIPQTLMVGDILGYLGDRAKGFLGDPVGRIVVAKPATESSDGLDVVTASTSDSAPSTSESSVALQAIDSFEALASTSAQAALVSEETLERAKSLGDAYQGPASLIAVEDPQAELEGIRAHYLYGRS